MPQMGSAVARVGSAASTGFRVAAWPFAATLLFFAPLWWEVIHQLKAEWSLNPQYGYGWAVPFCAIYLFWRRWQHRPTAEPRLSVQLLPVAILVVGAFLILPIRFIAEANPDWRLISWAIALVAVVLSLDYLFLRGGVPWLHYFAFPIVFFVVAVPWPVRLEQVLVQNLMRAVAGINVVLLNTIGIPSLQLGNVIEIRAGLIGIEEACSGVHSLQATLMVSLFLGEFYAFKIWPRILLVVVGAMLAFLGNLVRTGLLVWIGARNGVEAIEGWHDSAGLTILLICLAGLWAVCLLVRRNPNCVVQWSRPHADTRPQPLPWTLLAALGAWICFAEAGVQSWYAMHQQSLTRTRWTVLWPVSVSRYRSVPVAPEAEKLLRYNEGGGGQWATAEGHLCLMYFFRWFPGRAAALFIKNHRPDICLPDTGMVLRYQTDFRLVRINGVSLPVRLYRFDDHGTPLHVFYCYSDGRTSYENTAAAEQEDWTVRGRLRAAMQGRREIGTQMFELVVWGYQDDVEADRALQRELERVIRLS